MSLLPLGRALVLAVLALPAIACDSSSDGVVELRFNGPSNRLGPDSILQISLWGYEDRVADAAATLILEHRELLRALPVTVEILVPDDPHTLIDQGHGPVAADDAGYYFAFRGDLDGDGRLCQGELVEVGSEGPSYPRTIPAVIEVALEPWDQDVPCGAP
jgi:hypothetical protein